MISRRSSLAVSKWSTASRFPVGPAWPDFLDRFGAAYVAELEAFLRAALEGGESPCSGADARRALRVALAAERSKAENRPVRVEELG